MQRSALQPSSCACSTSYAVASFSNGSGRQCRRSLCQGPLNFESSCWGASSCAAFSTPGSSSRRRVGARGLLIEARRFRPDPIVPPFIIEERGGQEVEAWHNTSNLVAALSACLEPSLLTVLFDLAGLHRHVSAPSEAPNPLRGLEDLGRGKFGLTAPASYNRPCVYQQPENRVSVTAARNEHRREAPST